jgi:TonB family protein
MNAEYFRQLPDHGCPRAKHAHANTPSIHPTMKYLSALSLLVLVSASALASEQEDFYIGDANCRIFNPNPKNDEKATWTGDCKDGFATGKGVLQWYLRDAPDSRYEGEMEKGQPNGHGIYTYASKARYEGEFRNGKRNGKGVMTSPDGVEYEGQFKDGMRDGVGKIVFPNGDRYEGSWKNGYQEGTGTLAYASGVRYEGSWKNGKFDGKGVLVQPDGSKREVQYKEGKRLNQDGGLSLASYAASRFLRSYQATKAYAERYDSATNHKAFAQSALNAWGWSAGHPTADAAKDAALADCNAHVKADEPPCVVFEVDGDLVEEAAAAERALIAKFSVSYVDAVFKAVDPFDKERFDDVFLKLHRLVHPPSSVSRSTALNYERGVAALKANNLAEAQELFGKVAAAAPGLYDVQYAHAVTLMKAGRYPEANAAMKSALYLQQNKREAWIAEALIQTRMGDADAAQSTLVAAYETAAGAERLKTLDDFRNLIEAEQDVTMRPIYKRAVSRIEAHLAAERVAMKNAVDKQDAAGLRRAATINFSTCAKPEYPRLAQHSGHQGAVTMEFHITETGDVLDAYVLKSSGYWELDAAALNALSLCQFHVPKSDKPKDTWANVQYVWKLE